MTRYLFLILCMVAFTLWLPASSQLLRGQAKQDVVIPFAGFGLEVKKSSKSSLPALIIKVQENSLAARGGLQVGDKIIDASERQTEVSLTIERNGTVYRTKLKRTAITSGLRETKIATKAAATPQLNGRNKAIPKDKEVAALDKYDEIVVVIDKSGSMSERDCPQGLSRWDWCREQTRDFGRIAADILNKPMAVAVFSDEVVRYDNVKTDAITAIFYENKPDGGTNTGEALEEQFAHHFHYGAGRKLLMVVITDGAPNFPPAVENAIIDATLHMRHPDEITVTFLQIGSEIMGTRVLSVLDRELTNIGARCDIVNVKPSDEVVRLGIRKALVNALTEQSQRQFVPIQVSNRRHRQLSHQDLYSAGRRRSQIERQILDKYSVPADR